MTNERQIVLPNCRLSFVNILKPVAQYNGQGDPKYSVTVLLPKADVASKQQLDAAIQAAAQHGAQTKFNGQIPPNLYVPIHDGDGTRPNGEPFGDECKGCWVFAAKANEGYPPEVVDERGNKILSEAQVYSGMYGHVAIECYPYASPARRGIGLSLMAVKKSADGEPLGPSRPPAKELFKGLPTQQNAGAAPQQNDQFLPPVQNPDNNIFGI